MHAPAQATALFRDGLLDGQRIAVVGPGGEIASACGALGADVLTPAALTEEALGDALGGGVDTVVVDAAGVFAESEGAGLAALRAATDTAWAAARTAATQAMIDAPGGGRIVLVAPAPGAGPLAPAARAGLENMARTLSIEWARHRIRPTAILPGDSTAAAETAALVAFVASPAGEYYSGCAFSLGG